MNFMWSSLLPMGTFRPASWRILFIVFVVALIGASWFYYLIVRAAEIANS